MINSKEVLRAMNRDLYAACNVAAGVAPGTVLSTTPPLTLWNPPTPAAPNAQPHALIVLASRLAYVGGTLGAGIVYYAVIDQPTQPTGGAAITPVLLSTAVSGAGLPALGQAFSGSTLVGTPTQLLPAFQLNAAPATGLVLRDVLEGEIIVGPGKALCLQAIAGAGTSPLVQLALEWLETTDSFGQRRIQ